MQKPLWDFRCVPNRMRIGIVGLLRGLYMAESAHRIGVEVIAIPNDWLLHKRDFRRPGRPSTGQGCSTLVSTVSYLPMISTRTRRWPSHCWIADPCAVGDGGLRVRRGRASAHSRGRAVDGNLSVRGELRLTPTHPAAAGVGGFRRAGRHRIGGSRLSAQPVARGHRRSSRYVPRSRHGWSVLQLRNHSRRVAHEFPFRTCAPPSDPEIGGNR